MGLRRGKAFTSLALAPKVGGVKDVDWHSALALLEWQVELGVDECISETPVDRYALDAKPAAPPQAKVAKPAAPELEPAVDAVSEARALAAGAGDLAALRQVMEGYDRCELKLGARNFVFCDGVAGADLMIVGEAPGRDEDAQGKPFVGRAGQLLDKMLEAIGRDRTKDTYITNVLPWRPPRNRDPNAEEISMMVPFLARHIALAQPKVLVVMGNIACQAMLGRKGITRLRGQWTHFEGVPVCPMFHPAYLLRNPIAKREAWTDLLAVKARLKDVS